jgi:Zn-dependent metalloprotease
MYTNAPHLLPVFSDGKVLRCMDNPECDGRSISHIRKFRPGMDVHLSSGIFNKVGPRRSYLACTPYTHTAQMFVHLAQRLKSKRRAYDMFVVANIYKFTQQTTFLEVCARL